MFPEIRLSNLNEGGVRLNLKQRKKASEEFEKPRSREKLKKGDECEEEEGGSEEGKSWGEGGEANCLHLGNIEKSTSSKTELIPGMQMPMQVTGVPQEGVELGRSEGGRRGQRGERRRGRR